MKKRLISGFLGFFLSLFLGMTHSALAEPLFFPIIMRMPTPPPTGAIIADHNSTQLNRIPAYYIDQAKALLRASYGHTSHGSQVISGMQALEDNPSYSHLYDFVTNGAMQTGLLSIADGTPSGDLGNPDRVTWAALTRTYLNGSGATRNLVVWSWCGQAGWASAADINTYLGLMTQLEIDFPNVRFVYMTGHLDGTGPNENLYQRNNQIRDYVRAKNKILFDFADIESYDPAGNYYPDESDACGWCSDWCSQHPSDCASVARERRPFPSL